MTWIQTRHGSLDLADPRPEDIKIEDIVHALARLCRYAGHTRGFYSVAEHCCRIHDHLLATTGERGALAGLLHDASEAYTGDITFPMQLALGPDARARIKAVQRAIDDAIIQALSVPLLVEDLHSEVVKDADVRILIDERDALLGPSPRGPWDIERRGGKKLGVPIEGWTPIRAEGEWLRRFVLRPSLPIGWRGAFDEGDVGDCR